MINCKYCKEEVREKELELIFTKDDINYLLSNCIIRE